MSNPHEHDNFLKQPEIVCETALMQRILDAQVIFDSLNEFNQFTWGNQFTDELNPVLEANPFRLKTTSNLVAIKISGNDKLHSYKRPDGEPVIADGIACQVVNGSFKGIKGFAIVLIDTKAIFDDIGSDELPDFVTFVPIKNLLDHKHIPISL